MILRKRKLLALHLLTCVFYKKIIKIKSRQQRKWWVHPAWKNREATGAYAVLVQALARQDKNYFKKYMRMKPSEFNVLKNLVRPLIQKFPAGRKALSVGHRLSVTLRYLASGDSMASISFAFKIGFSTTRIVITETCDALWNVLSPLYLPTPTPLHWKNVERDFSKKWNFPNCIGAVDGKHVGIQAPPNSGSTFYNYKGFNSTVLMAVVDANYKFIVVDIGAFRSNSDGGIWKHCKFRAAYDAGKIPIPPPESLPMTTTVLPHVLIGDEAFQLRPNFMRPYPGKQLDNEKRIFNYRLSRARRCAENAFGITVNRWRILRSSLNLSVENSDKVVKACVCLHNFLMTLSQNEQFSYCPTLYADRVLRNGTIINGGWRDEPLLNLPPIFSGNNREKAEKIRTLFRNYFNSIGAVTWQNERARLI